MAQVLWMHSDPPPSVVTNNNSESNKPKRNSYACHECNNGVCQDFPDSAVHSDSEVSPNTNNGEAPQPGSTIISGTNQTSGTTNSLGCKSETWSGVEINNPIEMEARYWSTRDVNRVEAIYFWMAKEGEQAGASGSKTTTATTVNSWSPSGECQVCGPNGQCFTMPCLQFGANSQSDR